MNRVKIKIREVKSQLGGKTFRVEARGRHLLFNFNPALLQNSAIWHGQPMRYLQDDKRPDLESLILDPKNNGLEIFLNTSNVAAPLTSSALSPARRAV